MRLIIIGIVLAAVAAPASAQVQGCVLTYGVAGSLAMSTDGSTLGSETVGGLSSSILVVGANVALSFTSPAVIGPTGWSGTPTTLMSVAASKSAGQAYTTGGFTIRSSAAGNVLTINAKVLSSAGFKAGTYQASTQVTCQAA